LKNNTLSQHKLLLLYRPFLHLMVLFRSTLNRHGNPNIDTPRCHFGKFWKVHKTSLFSTWPT